MLRPYQEEAKTAVFREWETYDKTLLVLPTGCGKTVVFASIAEELVRQGKRVLILAHRGELLEQAADKIKAFTGLGCSVEKAEQTSLGEWYRITVGSVQSMLQDKRLGRFRKDYFDNIIVDEAHHAITDGYKKVLSHFESAKVLGVTATPDRGDMKNLGTVFDSLAYEYTLPQAIKDGYLVPIKALTVPLRLDLTDVGTQAGDYKAGDVDNALDPYLEQIAEEMKRTVSDRKTVVFLPLIRTAQKFCEILRKHGFRAAEINGTSEDRKAILQRFADGEIDVLCNAMLLTEGWDCPSVDCVVVLRPTKVRSLYAQMIGRGTRLCEGKKDLLLLDFLWHTRRHELCRPACLIAGEEDVAERMTKTMEDTAGVAFDLQDAQNTACTDVVKDRENALAEELRRQRQKKRELVDPLQYAMSVAATDFTSYVPSFPWEMQAMEDKTRKNLEKLGIFTDEIACEGQARKILDLAEKRREGGFSSAKQIRFLEGYGFRNVGQWSQTDAKKMIYRIKASGWKVPHGIVPEEYVPGG